MNIKEIDKKIEEKINDIKERASESNNYVLYVGKADVEFLLSVIEMLQKEMEDLKRIIKE